MGKKRPTAVYKASRKRKDRPAPARAEPPPDLSYIAEHLRPLAVPIDTLQEDPANANSHPEENLRDIRASLKQFGQVEPLITQKSTGRLVGGNGRIREMRAMGWTHVARNPLDLTDEQATMLSVVLNASARSSEWDHDALEAALKSIKTDDAELDAMLAGLAKDEGITPPDFQPVGIEQQGRLDEKAKVKCPGCGHEFAP